MKYVLPLLIVILVAAAATVFGGYALSLDAVCDTCYGDPPVGYQILFYGGITVFFGSLVVGVGKLAQKWRRNRLNLPDAGWYPDPDNPNSEWRYWSGYVWTDHRASRG